MIAEDTNIIAYLLISGERTPQVKVALRKDPEWVAPILWGSEFRSVLAQYLHRGLVTVDLALQFMREAELLMQGGVPGHLTTGAKSGGEFTMLCL